MDDLVPGLAGGPCLGTLTGLSMWPALRPGDRLFGRPLDAQAWPPPNPGAVLLAWDGEKLIAHRLLRWSGGKAWLAGDLSGPDLAMTADSVSAVVECLHRPGIGFLDVPPPLSLGPIGRGLVGRAAALWQAARRAHPPGPGEPQPPLLL